MFNGKELFASFKFGMRLKIYKDSKILSPTLSSRVISKILNDSTDTAAPHVFSRGGERQNGKEMLDGLLS